MWGPIPTKRAFHTLPCTDPVMLSVHTIVALSHTTSHTTQAEVGSAAAMAAAGLCAMLGGTPRQVGPGVS